MPKQVGSTQQEKGLAALARPALTVFSAFMGHLGNIVIGKKSLATHT